MGALSLCRKIKFQSCLPLTLWICKGRFVQRHYDLYIVQEHVSLVLLNHLNTMVRLSLSRKITLQSCLPLTPWTCKGRFVQPHYDLYIDQEHVSLVLLNALNMMVRLALYSKIKFQSCLPLTPWSCTGWFVQCHYDLHILQEHVSLGLLNHLNMMVRLASSRKITLQSCLPLTPYTCKGRFV